MNGSQIPAMLDRLRALLDEARAYTTPGTMAAPAGLTERLAAIDAGLADLAGEYQALIAAHEAQVRARELQLGQVADAIPVVLTIVDANGIITHYEGAGMPTFGLPPGQLVGKPVFDAFPENAEGLDHIRRALAGESLHSIGTYGTRTLEAFYTPLRTVDGAVARVIFLAYDVTDWVWAEQDLRTRCLLRQVVEHAPVVLTSIDAQGTYTLIAGAAMHALGFTADMVGQSVFAVLADYPEDSARVRRALSGETIRWTGTYAGGVVEGVLIPIRNETGAVVSVIGLIIDQTARVRAEADLRARSVLMHQGVGHVPMVFCMMGQDGVFSLCEGAAAPALGLDPRTLVGRSAFEVFASSTVELGHLRRALAGELMHWTGAYLNSVAEIWLIPLREAGTVTGVVAMAIDITDRMRAEQRLRERDAIVRQVVDHAPIILFALDADGCITFTDGKGLALIGETPGETVGRSIFDVRQHDAVELNAVRRALSGEAAAWVSPEPPYFDSRVTPIYDDAGQLVGAIGVAIDITDRVVAEQRLHDVELQLRELLKHAPIMLFATDRNGTITLSEGRGLELLGEAPGETVGQNIFDLWAPHPAAIALMRQAFDGAEVAWVSDDPPHFDSRLIPIRDASGQITGMLGIGIDITDRIRVEAERRELDRRLLESQKLESLGMLAGGIAHDFNNLLQRILGNVESALDEGAPTGPVRDSLVRVRTLTRHGADLTRQLLAYAGIGRFAIEVLDLNAVVRGGMEMLNVSMPKIIILTIQLADAALPIAGDATQIQQILINLVMNAADAIDGLEGTIAITTGRRVFERADLAAPDLVVAPAAVGDYAALTVSDNGPGMDAATRARVFEPFFTTKVSGRGLGLAAIQGILRSHGGGVRLITAPGQGTTFTVYLPMTDKPIVAPQAPAEPPREPIAALETAHTTPAPWTGSGTVLVVDDDPAVRDTAARNLRRLGFTTMSASNGRAAIEVFQAHQDEITCVLLDRVMPKMDGITTARELRAMSPDLCVIIMTGYNETDVVNTIDPGLVSSILFKPFTVEQLHDGLRNCLEKR